GRAYRARDLGRERAVAMKVLHPSLTTDPSVMERFRREAQRAGGLRHPSIVSIYDISSRAGLQWYTMELVPGTNLAQLVHKQGPLSRSEEHTSELQSRGHLVCRLLLEKKKNT